jgi:hypothetical protein
MLITMMHIVCLLWRMHGRMLCGMLRLLMLPMLLLLLSLGSVPQRETGEAGLFTGVHG